MKSDKMVWVELGAYRRIIRIFRSRSAAFHLTAKQKVTNAVEMKRSEAVGEIRHQIFVRSRGNCEICDAPIPEKTMHMHEQKHRGRGGEISLENSLAICATCHFRAHRDRRVRFGEDKI